MENIEVIAKEFGIGLVVLFGSRAQGRAAARSDYDVAYRSASPLALAESSKLAAAVAREYGFEEDLIDLIDLTRASPMLQFQVAASGKLLWGREDEFRGFKVLAWRRYVDTAKLRRWREENLKRTYAR